MSEVVIKSLEIKTKKMKDFSVVKFEDRPWLLHTYEKIRHQKDIFGGSFFSVLLLTFFFFLIPLPQGLEENLLIWKLGIFTLFIFITIGWYIKSMQYYKFCIKYLNYEYVQKRFPRKITYKVTRFSESQIIFYVLLALIFPVVASLFLEDFEKFTHIYGIMSVIAGLTVFTFLIKIEDFYEKRERLEEIEILTEALVYHDPLEIFSDNEVLTIKPRVKRLKDASFKEEGD